MLPVYTRVLTLLANLIKSYPYTPARHTSAGCKQEEGDNPSRLMGLQSTACYLLFLVSQSCKVKRRKMMPYFSFLISGLGSCEFRPSVFPHTKMRQMASQASIKKPAYQASIKKPAYPRHLKDCTGLAQYDQL